MSDSDAELFRRAVAGVTELKVAPRAHPHSARIMAPQRIQKQKDEPFLKANLAALSDEFEPAVGGHTEAAGFHPPHLRRAMMRKLRRGVWRVEAQLDLHFMHRFEARNTLCHFLQDAVQRGYRCVRVIHGKGRSSPESQPVLKGRVRVWLAQLEDVTAFCPACPQQGGEGAVMVWLRASRSRRSVK